MDLELSYKEDRSQHRHFLFGKCLFTPPIIIKINSNTWPNVRALSDWQSSTNYYGQTRARGRSGGIQPAGEGYELISPAVLSQ